MELVSTFGEAAETRRLFEAILMTAPLRFTLTHEI
jgi:hypothetical protein